MFVTLFRKKWIKSFIACSVALSGNFAYAQRAPIISAEGSGHSGGGDADASDFQGYINKIDQYLLTDEGMAAFPEIKQPEFHNILLQVKPVVKDQRVFDSFNVAQTCISNPEPGNRFFQCDLQRLPKIELDNQTTFYHLTFHELLFQNRMELPISKNIPSDFSISSRLELRLETFQAWMPGKLPTVEIRSTRPCTVHVNNQYSTLQIEQKLDQVGCDLVPKSQPAKYELNLAWNPLCNGPDLNRAQRWYAKHYVINGIPTISVSKNGLKIFSKEATWLFVKPKHEASKTTLFYENQLGEAIASILKDTQS